MRLHVDVWEPAYGTGFDAPDEPEGGLELDLAVEREPADWEPLQVSAGTRPASTVSFVDGVRRLDANVWIVGDDGAAHPGLCSSYAAGVVRCDGTARVVEQVVRRGLFSASPAATDVRLPGTSEVTYPARRVGGEPGDPDLLRAAVQAQLGATELVVAELARAELPHDGDDLLVVDGPLRGRAHLPRTLGYVKSQERRYLPVELEPVVADLEPSQRTPVFTMGTSWKRHAWYLRLPGPGGPPWAGIVRVECAAELTAADAIALADTSAATLPRFASREFREPRAPQNLVPIAGLERLLRSRLGDVRLLRRGLRAAAAEREPVGAAAR